MALPRWSAAALLCGCSLIDLSDLNGGSDASVDAIVDAQSEQADVSVSDGPASTDGEAGPFDANFYGGLELWLSADVGVTADDAGRVISNWKDQSIAGRKVSVVGSTPCQGRPTLTPIGVHGLPVVSFDGYTQCLSVSGAFTTFSGGFTSFFVFQPQTCNSAFTGDEGALFDSWDSTGASYASGIAVMRNPTPAQTSTGDAMLSVFTITNGTASIVGGGSWVPATPELLEMRLPAGAVDDLTTATAYVNGSLATLNPNTPFIPDFSTNRTTTFVGYRGNSTGGYPYFCGDIGEMMIFSKALVDADRQAIETHLKTKWGL